MGYFTLNNNELLSFLMKKKTNAGLSVVISIESNILKVKTLPFVRLSWGYIMQSFVLLLFSGSTGCPICPSGHALAFGQLSSVCYWWLLMPAPSFVTSLGLQKKPSPLSSASFSSMRLWKSWSTLARPILLIWTTTLKNSPPIRKGTHMSHTHRHRHTHTGREAHR